jgi:hypothetical protein
MNGWTEGGREGGWIDGWVGEINAEEAEVQEYCSRRKTMKRSRRCGAKGEGTRGLWWGAEKWGAWETRGEDCCGWGEPEQVQEGRKLKASSQGET